MSSTMEDYYEKITRILLKILGIWPYQDPKWARIQGIIIISLYMSFLFAQFAVFITHECTVNLLIDVFSFIFPSILALIIYGVHYFNRDFLKELMDLILYNWKSCENNAEIAMLDDYAYMAKFITKVSLCFTCIGSFSIIMFYAIPMGLNIILTRNESRVPHLHVMLEYFVDQYNYYSFIILHALVSMCLCMITIVAAGSILLNCVLHICAMLKITNYRMKTMMDQNVLQISNEEKEYIIYERLVHAVGVHIRTMQFVYRFQKSFCRFFLYKIATMALVIMIIVEASLSINLFRFLKVITAFNDVGEIFLSIVLISIHFIGIFIVCHIGQQIIDLNTDIYKTIYNLPWYTTSRNTRKLLLLSFVLQNGSKDLCLTFKGVLVASHECCKMIITSSLSFFTVLYSI